MTDDTPGPGNIAITAAQCLQDSFRDIHLAKRAEGGPENGGTKTYQEAPADDAVGPASSEGAKSDDGITG